MAKRALICKKISSNWSKYTTLKFAKVTAHSKESSQLYLAFWFDCLVNW